MRPTVGSIVHYVSHGTPIREDGSRAFSQQCRAAIVTEAPPVSDAFRDLHTIGLTAFNPTGMFNHPLPLGGSEHDDGSGEAEWSCDGLNHEPGTWHWPVDEVVTLG